MLPPQKQPAIVDHVATQLLFNYYYEFLFKIENNTFYIYPTFPHFRQIYLNHSNISRF